METSFGYTLSSEEFGPASLVEAAVRAEGEGFDFCSISDHFHPWVQAQGHSPFVWGVLGAVAAATSSITVGTGVTCPMIRTHPAIVAHASATASLLLEGRFFLGLGTGEALNEHILGDRWPRPSVRREMLEEAVDVLRKLWTGDTVEHVGSYYEVENARLFDPPSEPIPVMVSGFGSSAAELAGRIGDGLFGHGSDADAVQLFMKAGGSGPTYAQLNVCYGQDEEQCRKTVLDIWPNAAVPGQLSQDLPTWTHFEQATQLVTEEDLVGPVLCGPDREAIVDRARKFRDSGFDHIYFHQIGPDQQAFFDLWQDGLQGDLRDM